MTDDKGGEPTIDQLNAFYRKMFSRLSLQCIGLGLEVSALRDLLVRRGFVSAEELQAHVDAFREHHDVEARELFIAMINTEDDDDWESLWRSLM